MLYKDFEDSIRNRINVDSDGWVSIKDEVITEAIMLLDNSIIHDRLIIKNCIFKDFFYIENWTFEDYVSIENCRFEKGLRLAGGFFKKDIDLKWIEVMETFVLEGGDYGKINLSFRNTKKLVIMGGRFDVLDFSYWNGDSDFEELTIFNRKNLTGNINVSRKTFSKLSIIGHLNQDCVFENIKCGYLHIDEFSNSGNLKIFGLEPIAGQACYVEVIKSNLGRSHFFGIAFDRFDEVIFIDSYLGDTTFINTHWSSENFRAVNRFNSGGVARDRTEIDNIEKLRLKENFRQLKHVYEKQGDRIAAPFFYSLEMDTYNSTLRWKHPGKEAFWEKLIIVLSKSLSNYGSSFLRPLIGLLISTWVILLILIVFFDFKNLRIVLPWQHDAEALTIAIGEYCRLINPVHKIDESLTGFAVMWDLVSRILGSYFIYALIRSSRRFLR